MRPALWLLLMVSQESSVVFTCIVTRAFKSKTQTCSFTCVLAFLSLSFGLCLFLRVLRRFENTVVQEESAGIGNNLSLRLRPSDQGVLLSLWPSLGQQEWGSKWAAVRKCPNLFSLRSLLRNDLWRPSEKTFLFNAIIIVINVVIVMNDQPTIDIVSRHYLDAGSFRFGERG